MNEEDGSSSLNGRLRPRRSNVNSPQNTKTVKRSDEKNTPEKSKRTSTPSKSLPLKFDDLVNKSESSPQFLCPYCEKKFASKQTLSKHTRRLHTPSSRETDIECLSCNHTEKDSNVIIRHMVDSHPNQYFACLNCQTRFSSTSELAEHKLNVCEKQKLPYRGKTRRQISSVTLKKSKRGLSIHNDKDDFQNEGKSFSDGHGFNGIVISCELKPSQVHDEADIEDNITTNLILPPTKNLGSNTVIEKNAVIVLDDIQWNKRIPANFSFHNTDADQILSRLGVVHKSPRTGEPTRKDWLRAIDESTQKFEKCFDTSFYTKVASNVQENLNKFLDGSFNFNPDPDSVIKTRKSKASVVINTAEGFPILLAQKQFSRNVLDGYMPRAIAPKHKWKWDNLDNDKHLFNPDQIKHDSHKNNCIITLVSSLDIWTQLSMRRKFEDKNSNTTLEKKTDKKKIIGNELKEILESREIPLTSSSQVLRNTTPRFQLHPEKQDFPSSLGLVPTAPKYNIPPAVLSGEWVRPRCFVCCACGFQTRDPRALTNHITTEHPNAQVQHYEIVGDMLLNEDIFKHLYVPPSQAINRTRPIRGFKECTKCNRSITIEELHQHMLDCAGDTPTVRRKVRYRPFGVRRRRPRLPDNTIRRKIRKDVRARTRQKRHIRPRSKIRSNVGDADTIKKMLADLPAKRHRVMINPMSSLLRPQRKLDRQKKKLILKTSSVRRISLRPKNKNKNSTEAETNSDRQINNNNSNSDVDDNKPLRPKRRVATKSKLISTHNIEALKKKSIESPKRRSERRATNVVKKIHTTKSTEQITTTCSSGVQTENVSIDNNSQKIDLNCGGFSTRECSGRGETNNRDGQQPGSSRQDIQNHQNSPSPPQNVPLKHSIARLTANSETHDKSVQFHQTFLVQQECNNINQHLPSNHHLFFENEAAIIRFDKPPLYGQRASDPYSAQRNKLNKPRKGLNDCIAMLKNKLVEPTTSTSVGHISVQCGDDDPIYPLPVFNKRFSNKVIPDIIPANADALLRRSSIQEPITDNVLHYTDNKNNSLTEGEIVKDIIPQSVIVKPSTTASLTEKFLVPQNKVDKPGRIDSKVTHSISAIVNTAPQNDNAKLTLVENINMSTSFICQPDSINTCDDAREKLIAPFQMENVTTSLIQPEKINQTIAQDINMIPAIVQEEKIKSVIDSSETVKPKPRKCKKQPESLNVSNMSKKENKTCIDNIMSFESDVSEKKNRLSIESLIVNTSNSTNKRGKNPSVSKNTPSTEKRSKIKNNETLSNPGDRYFPSETTMPLPNVSIESSHTKVPESVAINLARIKKPKTRAVNLNLLEPPLSDIKMLSPTKDHQISIPKETSNKSDLLLRKEQQFDIPYRTTVPILQESITITDSVKIQTMPQKESIVNTYRVSALDCYAENLTNASIGIPSEHGSLSEDPYSFAPLDLSGNSKHLIVPPPQPLIDDSYDHCVMLDLTNKSHDRSGFIEDELLITEGIMDLSFKSSKASDLCYASTSNICAMTSDRDIYEDEDTPKDLSFKRIDTCLMYESDYIQDLSKGNSFVYSSQSIAQTLNTQSIPADLSIKEQNYIVTTSSVTKAKDILSTVTGILPREEAPLLDLSPVLSYRQPTEIEKLIPTINISTDRVHEDPIYISNTAITPVKTKDNEEKKSNSQSYDQSSSVGTPTAFAMQNHVTTSFTKVESTIPVYTLPNECISVTKIHTSPSVTTSLTNTLSSVPSVSIANTTPLYTVAGTTIGLHSNSNIPPLRDHGENVGSNKDSKQTMDTMRQSQDLEINLCANTSFNKVTKPVAQIIEEDPETAKKIALLPKEIVEILGTMPVDHRKQLLNVLPQYVAPSLPVPISTSSDSLLTGNASIPSSKTSEIKFEPDNKNTSENLTMQSYSGISNISSETSTVQEDKVIDLTNDENNDTNKNIGHLSRSINVPIIGEKDNSLGNKTKSKSSNDKTASLRAVRIRTPSERKKSLDNLSSPNKPADLETHLKPMVVENDDIILHLDPSEVLAVQQAEISSTQHSNRRAYMLDLKPPQDVMNLPDLSTSLDRKLQNENLTIEGKLPESEEPKEPIVKENTSSTSLHKTLLQEKNNDLILESIQMTDNENNSKKEGCKDNLSTVSSKISNEQIKTNATKLEDGINSSKNILISTPKHSNTSEIDLRESEDVNVKIKEKEDRQKSSMREDDSDDDVSLAAIIKQKHRDQVDKVSSIINECEDIKTNNNKPEVQSKKKDTKGRKKKTKKSNKLFKKPADYVSLEQTAAKENKDTYFKTKNESNTLQSNSEFNLKMNSSIITKTVSIQVRDMDTPQNKIKDLKLKEAPRAKEIKIPLEKRDTDNQSKSNKKRRTRKIQKPIITSDNETEFSLEVPKRASPETTSNIENNDKKEIVVLENASETAQKTVDHSKPNKILIETKSMTISEDNTSQNKIDTVQEPVLDKDPDNKTLDNSVDLKIMSQILSPESVKCDNLLSKEDILSPDIPKMPLRRSRRGKSLFIENTPIVNETEYKAPLTKKQLIFSKLLLDEEKKLPGDINKLESIELPKVSIEPLIINVNAPEVQIASPIVNVESPKPDVEATKVGVEPCKAVIESLNTDIDQPKVDNIPKADIKSLKVDIETAKEDIFSSKIVIVQPKINNEPSEVDTEPVKDESEPQKINIERSQIGTDTKMKELSKVEYKPFRVDLVDLNKLNSKQLPKVNVVVSAESIINEKNKSFKRKKSVNVKQKLKKKKPNHKTIDKLQIPSKNSDSEKNSTPNLCDKDQNKIVCNNTSTTTAAAPTNALEKRKLASECNTPNTPSSKPKKSKTHFGDTKLINLSKEDKKLEQNESSPNINEMAELNVSIEKVKIVDPHKPDVVKEPRATPCYSKITASRRTRSKSVAAKPSSIFDPYDIDLEEMVDEPLKNKGISKNINNNRFRESKLSSKIKDLKTTLKKDPSECSLKCLAAQNDPTNYKFDDIDTDSGESSKSDVPLKKYVEEKQKKSTKLSQIHTKKNIKLLPKTGKYKTELKSRYIKKNKPATAVNITDNTKNVEKETDEELRSNQFMESFGFFSERKPRKSNLLASKKIAETFHIIASESDEAYFEQARKRSLSESKKKGSSEEYTSAQNSTKKAKCAKNNKNPATPEPDSETETESEPSYCDICKKEFRRPDNFTRHCMSLLHISKISEVEFNEKTVPVIEEPNYLIAYKQQLDKLKILTDKLAKRKKTKNAPKIVLPTMAEILEDVRKTINEQQIAKRCLSKDEALFIHCCELLKEAPVSNINSFKNSNTVVCIEPAADLNRDNRSDGDCDSITAKTILESEEVRNLENDLISGFKEAACGKSVDYPTLECCKKEFKKKAEETREQNKQQQTRIEVPVTDTTKTKKYPEYKEKMYPDIEDIDMFEDKFDKIKRKCRSQAAAAKQIQPVVELSASLTKERKKIEKKKGKRNAKKINQQATVLTKGALKGFDGIKVSIPTSDINISAIENSIKKKKKNSLKKRRSKTNSESSDKRDANKQLPGGSSGLQSKMDVYEFMDNDDAELFEFRPSTLMERFKSMSNKETPSTSKGQRSAVKADESSDTGSDGDDFVYMSDDYVCSDDETESSLMSFETNNERKSNSEVNKTLSPLKRKEVTEKSAVMGKIFKNNAVRTEKKLDRDKEEPPAQKISLDQLFDSLLEEELQDSLRNKKSPSKNRNGSSPDKYRETSTPIRKAYIHSPPKDHVCPLSSLNSSKFSISYENYKFSIPDNYEKLKRSYIVDASTKKSLKEDYDNIPIDYGPSTSKLEPRLRYKDIKLFKKASFISKKQGRKSTKTCKVASSFAEDSSSVDKTMNREDDKYFSENDEDLMAVESNLKDNEKRLDTDDSAVFEMSAQIEGCQLDDTGVARQRARRKCTVGKQNVLAETWSSESDGDAARGAGDERRRRHRRHHVPPAARRKHKKGDGHCRSGSAHRHGAGQPGPPGASGSKADVADEAEAEGEAGGEPEHVQQHGWIVGDSHKKLVTMLAHAKGRKRNDGKRHLLD